MSESTRKLQTSTEIRNHPAIVEFHTAAYEFCHLFQQKPTDKDQWCIQITMSLSRLYAAGHRLPEVNIENSVDIPAEFDVSTDEWKAVYGFVSELLGWQKFYRAYFDPTEPIDDTEQEPSIGDLADDLADIYRDIKPGLTTWDTNQDEFLTSIVFDWKSPLFDTHWGLHAVSALHVLHTLAYLRGIQSEA